MQKTVKHLLATGALAGIATAGLVAFSPPADALPAYDTIVHYYASSSHNTEVGQGELTCSGNFVMYWGHQTNYLVADQQYPCVFN